MPPLKVLYYRVGKDPELVSIPNELEAMQKLVGGPIEQLHLFGYVVLICNEEGKLNDMPSNRRVGDDVIVGDFFITGIDIKAGYISLPDVHLSKVLNFMEAQ